MQTLKNIFNTALLVVIICCIWQMLEKAFYGQIQPKTVDDIMLILMLPCFYRAVSPVKVIEFKRETEVATEEIKKEEKK